MVHIERDQPTRPGIRRRRRPVIAAGLAAALIALTGAVLARNDRSAEGLIDVLARPGPVEPLLVRLAGDSTLALQPVDSGRLDPVRGIAPVPIGHHFVTAASHDGARVAFIGWPSDATSGGRLGLIGLAPWSLELMDASIGGHVTALAFRRADGTSLAWLEATGPRTAELVWTDGGTEDVAGRLALPDALVPWEMRALPDGRIAILAVETDVDWMNPDPPRVIVADPESGRIVADVAIEGVIAGQRRTPDGGFESHRPAIAWDLGSEKVFAVASDADRITVVDLRDGRIERSTTLVAEKTVIDAVAGWLVPSASAKLVPGTERTGVLDPSGRRLYVASLARSLLGRDRGFTETPLGGFVADTASLRIVGRIDLPVSEVASPPGGRLLLAWGTGAVAVHGAAGEVRSKGIYVIDPSSLAEIHHIETDGPARVLGFSRDGQIAYVQEWQPARNGRQACLIRSIDLDRLEILGERRLPDACDLIATPPR